MEAFNLMATRVNRIKIELDPEYFNEEWFEDFRSYMYDLYTLEELADHIAYNVIENGSYFIEGVGTPLRDGKVPTWAGVSNLEKLNKHVNVCYNIYNTEWESVIN